MIILRNNRNRAASLVVGILLLVFIVSGLDFHDTMSEGPTTKESVDLEEAGVSRAMREASFFQPIIQLTVKVHEHYTGGNHGPLPVEEAVLYRRR